MAKRMTLSPQAKRNLSNGFGCLVSNQRAIDAAKELPLWLAIIFFVLSLFIPTIPNLVTTSQTYGSSFLSSATYGTDVSLYEGSTSLKAGGYEFKLEDGSLNKYLNGEKKTNEETSVYETPLFQHVNAVSGNIQLEIYYVNYKDQEFANFATSLSSRKFKIGTTIQDQSAEENIYAASFLILAPTDVFMGVYKNNSTTVAGSTYRGVTWGDQIPTNTNLIADYFLKGTDGTNTGKDVKTTFSNWCTFFDQTYLSERGRSMGIQCGLFAGIYAGLIIFMGLLLFLLTRGKKNIFNFLSFFTCEKISVYAALAPAILALILGFILPQFAQMAFIVLFGVRIMWLTMKQLRPQ